ncbi:MAG: 5'/3'-nucleotidase SurE [Pseudomonadales bacterium]
MDKLGRKPGERVISWKAKALATLVVALFVSGCYTPMTVRHIQGDGVTPWWCKGTPDLDDNACLELSLRLDQGVELANQYRTLSDFTADGATLIPNAAQDSVGEAYGVTPLAPFNAALPNVLLYDGTASTSRVVGFAWAVAGTAGAPPAGLPGDRDVWTFDAVNSTWWLQVWAVRGYLNHPNLFATAHPCLAPGVTLTATTDACYVASHTEPFDILVSNDDGYSSEGIDAIIEALFALPNVSVDIVAPLDEQSGSSDGTTQPPNTTSGSAVTTLSGRAAIAVASTDTTPPRNGSGSPADSVIYALDILKLTPDIVISGINAGQNIGPLSALSGTVGAARTAARKGVRSIATSQGGILSAPDFPAGVAATMALLEDWRLGREIYGFDNVLSINIPTCDPGLSPRGALDTVVAQDVNGRNVLMQDCASTETVINDDIDAFNNGFISITDVGIDTPPNWN